MSAIPFIFIFVVLIVVLLLFIIIFLLFFVVGSGRSCGYTNFQNRRSILSSSSCFKSRFMVLIPCFLERPQTHVSGQRLDHHI